MRCHICFFQHVGFFFQITKLTLSGYNSRALKWVIDCPNWPSRSFKNQYFVSIFSYNLCHIDNLLSQIPFIARKHHLCALKWAIDYQILLSIGHRISHLVTAVLCCVSMATKHNIAHISLKNWSLAGSHVSGNSSMGQVQLHCPPPNYIIEVYTMSKANLNV